ncbi:hypothetical protein F1847_04440 [Thermodesulfobacterium sp. TA1]|uniref:STT3 domain-containing protein n=1 Tax=Thermodesulfobacterium sp. TA1 TaxID=2234087 RepID=UPI00123245C9|nr:STT3 domain-containing protein [Thermodesulfobacterium sp. TA1]QER42030.1 hypothetical protein F1847_04440 [Thermodesulfobacterium sp. TA1]
MNKFLRSYYLWFLLTAVLFWGLYIRFEDVNFWQQNKNFFYFKEKPIYSEYDSFFFARVAEDIKQGRFKTGEIDHYRVFPDNSSSAKLDEKNIFYAKYQFSGHFISFIWAYLSKWFNLSLETLTFYLIPVLAVSVVIPLFFYFKDLGCPYAGLIGALVTVGSSMYWGRTNLMRLDHDVFNLTLPFLTAYFFYKFFSTEERRLKYLWVSLSSLFLLFYQLWYGHPNLCFVLVLMFLIRYFWDKKLKLVKEDYLYLAILIVPQVWYLYEGPYHLFLQVKTLVFNIKSTTSADLLFKDFPNVFISISELQREPIDKILETASYSAILGLLGILGVLLCFIYYFKNLFFLLPFLGIGFLSFVSGARFIMYLSPFIGIGLGFLVHFLFEKVFGYLDLFKQKEKQLFTVNLIGTLVFLLVILVQKPIISMASYPKVFSPIVKNMEYLKEKTPQGAAIWTWWDYGYAFQYYSRRPTFHDGGSQNSPKTYFIARSFTTGDPKEGWFITSFITNHGLKGIAEELKKGISAKELVKKVQDGTFAEELKNPVYWVFTEDLIAKFGWIHYFGSYDFDKKQGIHGNIIVPERCTMIADNILDCQDIGAKLDLNSGVISTDRQSVPIKKLIVKDPKGMIEKRFFENGIIVEIVKFKENHAAVFILNPMVADTLFNKMYILRDYNPDYFELILDDFPHMVVYRVKEKIK